MGYLNPFNICSHVIYFYTESNVAGRSADLCKLVCNVYGEKKWLIRKRYKR